MEEPGKRDRLMSSVPGFSADIKRFVDGGHRLTLIVDDGHRPAGQVLAAIRRRLADIIQHGIRERPLRRKFTAQTSKLVCNCIPTRLK